MYDIICCIILGFFTAIGISNTIYFLIEYLFKSDNFEKEELTAENAEYVLRRSKYHKVSYKIRKKNSEELKFIYDKLYLKDII